MDDGNDNPFEKPSRHVALLAIVESIVLVSNCEAVKHLGCIAKVELVSLEIGSPLALVPSIQHWQIVYTS